MESNEITVNTFPFPSILKTGTVFEWLLFAFLKDFGPPKMGSVLERLFFYMGLIPSFTIELHLSEKRGKMKTAELIPLYVYSFTLNKGNMY